jgi:hypothetical protein
MAGSKSTARAAADGALGQLYGAPLDAFVALRRSLADALRASGEAGAARDVLAAKKPSRTAWAMNQVSRRHPAELRAAFDAHDAATRAQAGDDAESIRDGARAFRDQVAGVVRRCAEALGEAEARLDAAQARRLGETVRAAAAGGAEARARLLAGRLTEDLDVEDPFSGLEASLEAGVKGRGPTAAENAAARAREREAQAREARERALEQARRDVEALEEQAREARMAARQAETLASRAQAEADRARRAVVAIEERLGNARKALKEA